MLYLQVWPGKTAFPDFTNPVAVDYWYDSISNFHETLSFDGLWIVSCHYVTNLLVNFKSYSDCKAAQCKMTVVTE